MSAIVFIVIAGVLLWLLNDQGIFKQLEELDRKIAALEEEVEGK